MEQMNRTHFQNFMAKLENFREEEIQVLQEYLEPVFEVREKILSSFSDEKASSRFSVGEISDELMYVNLLEDLLQTDERISECRMDFDACDIIPVSYTHLDVYKRQLQIIPVPFCFRHLIQTGTW